MKVMIKNLQILLVAVVFASCSKDTGLQQIIVEQPNSFVLSISDASELTYAIKANDKIGINGVAYPVLYNSLVSLYNVPVEPQYLIYYPSGAEFSENNMLQFTLPETQKYVDGSVDPAAYPLYSLTDNEGLDSMTMNPVCGGLKLMVPANDQFNAITSVSITSETDILTGTVQVDGENGQLDLVEEQASKKIILKGEIDISEGQDIFIALPQIVFNDVLNIQFTTLKGMGTCTIDLTGKSIERGKVLAVELEDIDWLAKTDYYGKANSVIVTPGATSVTVDCTPYYTTSLQYTYENHPNEDEGKLPRSAKMLWNDVSSDFVGGVSLAADGKSFTAQLNGQPGNALIAIYDKEDPDEEDATILWSFHIWVTETNDIQLGTNGKGNTYTVLDRNLGAVSANAGDWRSIGMLYQWGRKDPFVSTGTVGQNSNATMYNHNGTVSLPVVAGGATTGTVAYAIQNPTQFIRSSQTSSNTSSMPFRYAHDWLYYANDALWGNPEGYNFPAFSTLRKSIYDPSPEGYMIAPADIWLKATSGNDKASSIFADAEWDATNLGYRVQVNGDETWYTIGGWRSRSNGNLSNANSTGYYWSSAVSGAVNANAWYMSINSGGVTLNGANSRANSAAIRPIKIPY
jgi:hypothetical protein